jgi:Flp pilus assembly pilin Flp
LQASLVELRRALALQNNLPHAYNRLGTILTHVGLLDHARAMYERGRPFHPQKAVGHSLKETPAQDLVEYALIIAVIALGTIPVVSGVRYALSALYARQAATIHQNLATPQPAGQTPATKGVPATPETPPEAERVSGEPSGTLNTR